MRRNAAERDGSTHAGRGRHCLYIYVDFMQEPDKYYQEGPSGKVKARIEVAAGERCLIVPYRELSLNAVEELAPRAIVMSGFADHLQSRRIEWFYGAEEVLRLCERPTLCICGTHQLLAHLWGRDIRRLKGLRDLPMRRIGKDEDWPREPRARPELDLSGYFIARGHFPIRRLKPDPLFTGLPETMVMRCSHYCEVKKLPEGFELIATSGHCRIEAMRLRHETRILYGVQFHPESYAEPFMHGKLLLENWAGIVERYWRRKNV